MVRPLEKRQASFRKEFQNHLMSELDKVMEVKPSFTMSGNHHDRIKREIEKAVGEITDRDADISKAPVAQRLVERRIRLTQNYISSVVDEAINASQGRPKRSQPTLELEGKLKGEDLQSLKKQVDVEIQALDELSDDLEKKEVSPHHDPKKGKWQPKDED